MSGHDLTHHVAAAMADDVDLRAGSVGGGHLVIALSAGTDTDGRALDGLAVYGEVGGVAGYVYVERTGTYDLCHDDFSLLCFGRGFFFFTIVI